MGEKKPMGRPLMLTDEHREKARWYVDGGYEVEGDIVPNVAGLADFLGTHRETIRNWAEIDDDIFATYKRLSTKQERLLITGGLNGSMSPSAHKLMMHNHGYSDKVESKVDSKLDATVDAKVDVTYGDPVVEALKAKHNK